MHSVPARWNRRTVAPRRGCRLNGQGKPKGTTRGPGLLAGEAQPSHSLCEDSFFLLLIHPQCRSYVWSSDPPWDCESGLRRSRGHSSAKLSKQHLPVGTVYRNCVCTLRNSYLQSICNYRPKNSWAALGELQPTNSAVFLWNSFRSPSRSCPSVCPLVREIHHQACRQHDEPCERDDIQR